MWTQSPGCDHVGLSDLNEGHGCLGVAGALDLNSIGHWGCSHEHAMRRKEQYVGDPYGGRVKTFCMSCYM